MTWKNTTNDYGIVSKAFHWIMLLLLIAVFASIELRSLYPKGSEPREAIKGLHFMLGLLVFMLVWIRLGLRLLQSTPEITPVLSTLQKFISKITHIALYSLMIVLPILGWLTVSAAGKDIAFFGLDVPSIIAADKALADQFEDLHKTIGECGYYLIGLHTLAALFHHYIKKDNTLIRMLPFHNKQ
jgi:cytochrome b561